MLNVGAAWALTRRMGRGSLRLLTHPGSAVLVAVMIRAVVATWRGTLNSPEPFETDLIVRNWMAGRGFTYPFLGTAIYRSFHSLLPYDLLTAGVYGLTGGSRTAMLVVQWLCAALLVVVMARLGRRAGVGVATLAAWLAACHPGLVVYDATKLQQFSLDALLVCGCVLALVRWAEVPSLARAAAAGALTGCLLYERGTIGLFFPVAALWVRRIGKVRWRTWSTQIACYTVVASAVILPWVIRNALVHHRFVPMMTTTWMALWKGNNAITVGTEYIGQDTILAHLPAPLREEVEGADEIGQMEAFRRAALQFIGAHPGEALRLFFQKLGFFWWRSPHTGLLYPAPWVVAYHVWYLSFMGLAFVGLIGTARRGGHEWAVAQLIVWLVVLFSAGQSLFYVAGRHRFTIEPTLGWLSAAGLVWVAKRLVIKPPRIAT